MDDPAEVKEKSRKRPKRKTVEANLSDSVQQCQRVRVDKTFLSNVHEFARKNRPRALTREEKIDIVLLQAHFRHEFEETRKKIGASRTQQSAKATVKVATILKRKKDLVADVWRDYVNQQQVSQHDPPANRGTRPTLVPNARAVETSVQTFIRKKRITQEQVVARDVMDHLIQCGYISNQNPSATLRSVQRYLLRKGYRRGKTKGTIHYRLREENLLLRDSYVRRVIKLESDASRRIVYMDESYIHKNYSRHEDSIYDPNDEQDLTTVVSHKGQRYCFIGAIISADQSIPDSQRSEYQHAHFMMDTLDIFEGGKRQTKDYHGMFYHIYFVGWMKKLLDALRSRNVKNAVIIMDNAKYHKVLPEDTPRRSNSKAAMREACKRFNIEFEESELKSELWNKLEKFIQERVQPTICEMAKSEGHEVLFTPPHHSNLQPIETVWGIVKDTVGRQYSTSTTFKDVLVRLKAAFNSLSTRSVEECIKKANECLKNLYEHIITLEACDDEDDAYSNSDVDLDSSVEDELDD